MNQIIITIPLFRTHAKKSANKSIKINGNAIYSGNMHRFTRAKVVEEMHEYIGSYLGPYKGLNIDVPIRITYKYYTPLNHGSISLRKGLLCWKPVNPGYTPNWDIENLHSIYSKVGNDALTLEGVIKDDNVSIVKSVYADFEEIADIKDRKIEIIIDFI